MVHSKKVVVILPSYNSAKTLELTYSEIPFDIVDTIILTDDASHDATVEKAKQLKIPHIIRHEFNRGYGANQKTCYTKALQLNADIIVMLHPDYQYSPKLIHSMVYLIALDVYPVVLGSRILGGGALKGGMPVYKYIANRILTFFQNILCGAKLSEYHTGYRAFSANVLRQINYLDNSDGFVFDNEMLSQILCAGFPIAEITCPTRYFVEASSTNFQQSLLYGMGVVKVSIQHFVCKLGVFKHRRYKLKDSGQS